MKVLGASLTLVIMLLASVASHAKPVTGQWGGSGVSLFATLSGADGDFNCQFGRLESPIQLDENKNFSVSGFIDYYDGTPRPPKRLLAQFSGHVSGKIMHMRVALSNGASWSFNLRKGALGDLCLARH